MLLADASLPPSAKFCIPSQTGRGREVMGAGFHLLELVPMQEPGRQLCEECDCTGEGRQRSQGLKGLKRELGAPLGV